MTLKRRSTHAFTRTLIPELQDLETALQSTYHAHLEDLAQTFVDTTQQWQADLHAMHDDLTRLKALDAERDRLLTDLTARLMRLQALEGKPMPSWQSSEDSPQITSTTKPPHVAPSLTIEPAPSAIPSTTLTPQSEPGSPTLPSESVVWDKAWDRQPEEPNLNDPVLPKLVQNF